MAKQAVTAGQPAIPVPQIAPKPAGGGARVQRVTGAADAGEVRSAGARAAHPPMANEGNTQPAPTTKVIQWDNGAPRGTKLDDETPPGAMLNDQTGGSEGAIGAKPAKAAKDRDDPLNFEADDPAAAAAGAAGAAPTKPDEPPAPSRRSAALAALEQERKTRELEQAVKTLQEQNAALNTEAGLAKALKTGTLAQRMKALGLSKTETADLLERLLVKDPEFDGGDAPAAAPAKKEDPEVTALKATVDELKRRLDGRDGNDEAAQIARAEANVANDIKDEDLPLVHSEIPVTITEDGKPKVITPVNLVLRTAHQMWLDSGKNGSPKDYVKRAGANVEAHLREKNPKLAERIGAAKPVTAGGGGESAPAGGSAPSLGRRTGGGPPSAPKKLPRDRDQRDQEIKREMGW